VAVDETMRAVRLHAPRREQQDADLRIDEVAVPGPGPGQVLVRVHACGVDEADVAVTDNDLASPLPIVLGREAAGTVAELGQGVADWRPQDRVAIAASQPCGRCPYCTGGRDNLCIAGRTLGTDVDGAHAAYVVVDARYLLPVPPEVPIEQAALTTQAVAGPYHALKRGGVGDGVTVSVHGLRGRGLHAILLARLTGAHVIGVDTSEDRLARALDWGADAVVDAADPDVAGRVHELTEGGADRAFEFTGLVETLDTAVRCLRPGGRATVTGWDPAALRTVPMSRLVTDELELVGSGAPTVQDVGELLDLLADGRLDLSRSVTHRLTIDEVPGALTRLASDEGGPVRMMAFYG
jgi:D-arabinose 1-dehydrogenase-like Zn-dependent alcohol dehydrogenase